MAKCKIFDIPEIPQIPDGIIQAVNDKKLAVFIGAGVSRLLGCWGWDRLASELVNCCFENGYINFKEKETIGYMNDQKKVITMCYGILDFNNKKELFYEKMKKALEGDQQKIENKNIYDEISDFNALYITTNADEHFDNKFLPGNIKYKIEDLDKDKLNKEKLYHIHGSIKDRESLVFRVDEYIKRYNTKEFNDFMKEISSRYIILFIGYGLAEFEILDFLVTKFYDGEGKMPKHYALVPYFKGEENICEYEQFYYKKLGINIVPYAKDTLGYDQLYEVIKKWRKDINVLSIVLQQSFKYIKECVENFNEKNVENVLQKIKNNKSLQDEFFNQLAETDKSNLWFEELKKQGYFLPNKNPKPIEDKWNVLDFLFNVSDKNKKNEDTDITKLLIEIIDEIIDYEKNRIENWRTDKIIIKIIMNLPQDKIKDKYIDFIITALKSKWNNGFLEGTLAKYELAKILSKEQMLKLLESILEINDISNRYINPVIDIYWLQQILNKNKDTIGKEYPFDAANRGLNKIQSIIKNYKESYICYLINHTDSIENDDDGLGITYEKELINFTRDMLQYCSPKEISEKIKEIINSNDAIYRRLAIHIISYHYEKLKDIFWGLEKNPLEDYESKYEIYRLLEDKSEIFNNSEIDKILYWIENKTYFIPENYKNDEEMKKIGIAYNKKEFLYPLLNSKNEKVISLYNKYNKINPTPIEHPEEMHKVIVKDFNYISPLKVQDLEKMTIEQICKFLNEFKESNDFEEPSEEGLAETFEKYIIHNFSKEINNLNEYLDIPVIYQDAVISVFNRIDLSNNSLYIEKILNFIERLSEKRYISLKSENDYRKSSLISLVRFIESGLLDVNDLNYNNLKKIKYVLIKIIENVKEKDVVYSDYITNALNTIKGTSYIALVKYSLKVASIKYSDKKIKWENDVKELFNCNLDKEKETSLNYSAVLGMYLPQLMYLDEQWVVQNIDGIFDKNLEKYWQAAMESYLGYSKFELETYRLIKNHSHYEKGLITNFNHKGINERMIQHVCIGYLNGEESLEEKTSLIVKLLDKQEIKSLEHVIEFILTSKNENIDTNIKLRIKELWRKLIFVLENNSEYEEAQKLLFELCKWINLIDVLDEDVVMWVKKYIKNCRHNYETYWIIKGLLKHGIKEPNKVADIYLVMIENEIYPRYENEIRMLVTMFYNNGLKKQADEICNSYLSKGIKFLQDIYCKFNKVDKF
ncbi:SIR2 family protein [Clostridium sporogenes]|uniref:SIR2 family protein n=1 Tax=Clostridium sporogenes TaxID=1509 RepID=UPI001C0F5207|nr:SIR2 family protein [Clostridium sporogenes]MBU5301007.1 SIR2 family protein [Clostridium sporogenes]